MAKAKVTTRVEKPILVIEDEDNIREIIKYTLEQEGQLVKDAANGELGLEMAREDPQPKVILLDWNMPGMDGMEVLAAIREDYKTERIPVIMLTAEKKMGNIDDAFDARVDGYITKPFDPDVLWPTIKKNLIDVISNRQKYWKKAEDKAGSLPGDKKKKPGRLVG